MDQDTECAASLAPDTRPESPPYQYGTFWQRAGAAALDAMLWNALTMGLNAIRPGQTEVYASILVTPLFWIYEIGTVARWGQTFGKMFTGVQVTRIDFNRIGFGRASLRSAVTIALGCVAMFYELHLVALIPKEIVRAVPFKYVGLFASHFGAHNLTLLFWPLAIWEIAELVTMLFHPHRRAIHDLIAGTVVVQTRSAAQRKGVQRAVRVAPAILGWVLLSTLDMRDGKQPYRSYSPDGSLQGEYVPWGMGSGTKLVVYWANGSVRHVLTKSPVKDSMPRRIENAWQSFDESGTLTRDIKFEGTSNDRRVR